MNRSFIFLVLFLGSTQVAADTRYVTDELIITVRSGRSNEHQIVKLLRSGEKIDVLEEIEENGKQYARIQAGDVTGWVLTQYLSSEPIARIQLENARNNAASLAEENKILKSQIIELQRARSKTEKQYDKLKSNNESMGKQLTKLKRVSARPLALEENNENLRTELTARLNELKLLRQENDVLKSSDQRGWFVAGAGVVIASMIFGIMLTRIRWRRSSSWSGSL